MTTLTQFGLFLILTWIFLDMNLYKNSNFLTAYPSLIVHVVIERSNYIQKGLRLHQ